jgi:2-dehydro-3-deoxyphosphogluconate aldolase/(4S)-4-hydroxy-2-oxoglutarate aldolase
MALQDEAMPSAERLIHSLRAQPLLIVLRPGEPLQAAATLERLQALGLRHVEIAWQPLPHWAAQMAELIQMHPALELGAASVCEPRGVTEAAAAGCRYAVSPVLDPTLLEEAARRDLVLVPGVMTASEVHRARRLGCSLVKLFPAVSVGIEYWRRLREPLGEPLPSPQAGCSAKTCSPGCRPVSMRWRWAQGWGAWRRPSPGASCWRSWIDAPVRPSPDRNQRARHCSLNTSRRPVVT